MMTPKPVEDLFCVVPTPFLANGQVDKPGMVNVVEYMVTAGTDGLVFPGVASEFNYLEPAEREELTTLISEVAGGRVPLVVGASAATAESAGNFARQGAQVGAVAAMVMAPGEMGGDVPRLIAFFKETAALAQIPIIMQNAPHPVGAGLDVATVLEVVSAVAAIHYVKEETMPCGQRISQLLENRPTHLRGVLGGAGGRYIMDELNRGALGTMPAAELTEVHAALVGAFRAGDVTLARALYNRMMPLLSFQAVFRMAMTKEILRRRGFIQSAYVRAPGPVMDSQDLAELNIMLDELKDLIEPPLKTAY